MTRPIGVLSALGVLLLGATASAEGPGWCKGLNGQSVSSAGPWDSAAKDDPTDAVPAIVACLCEHKCGSSSSDFAEHGAAVEEARHKWSQRLEMADDDWADAAEWATNMASMRQGHEVQNDKDKVAWSTLDPVGQYLLLNWHIGHDYDASYMADAFGPKLSESGRLAYIHGCLGSNNHEVEWAMCQPDIAVLDPKKVAAELHADKDHTGFQRFMIRLAMDRLRETLPKHAADVKASTDKDPAYAQMFTIAAGTRKEWNDLWRSDAALVDLTLAMDDARVTSSRSAFAGCDDKTWPAFTAAVGTIPAAQFASIETDPMKWKSSPREQAAQIIVASPKGYLAAVAHFTCHSGDDKKDPVIRALGESLMFWPGFRGPRDATQIAIASAGLQLDDRSAHIEYPAVHREWFGSGFGGSSGGSNGVVKTVKPQGDLVHIEFTTVKTQQPRCVQYAYTHRLVGIDSSGHFMYESGCAKEAMVSVDQTSSPVNVQKRYAEGVKPGMKLWATEDAVDLVWPKAGTRTPCIVAGAAVK